MIRKELSKESTIYHYKLLQRIHYNSRYFIAYWCLPGILFLWDLIRLQPLPMLIGVLLIPVLHTVLIYLYFTLKEKRPLHQWKFQFTLPWFGYAPTNYIALYRIQGMNIHLLWVTAVICGCFYPWIPLTAILHLMFIHVWIMLPRFIIQFFMRQHQENGYLKLNDQDASCYEQ
ncbi:hypothetical protein ACFQ88_38250 [Paenibacillus sp. NPDC056579]|uniref:hypothetical protein n=1 Tax=Paenibacillus sp. NPDC056579 TaxID=3345871 RepID=UPI003673FD85